MNHHLNLKPNESYRILVAMIYYLISFRSMGTKLFHLVAIMIYNRIKFPLIFLCLIGIVFELKVKVAANVTKDGQTKVSGTLIGRNGLLAVPIMRSELMPKPIMGVGISSDGKVYVTETIRQQREEISLIQSPFLHEKDMELLSTKAKRVWIIENYSSQIAAHQGVGDYNGDGKVAVSYTHLTLPTILLV